MNSKKRLIVSLTIFLLVFIIGVTGFMLLGKPGTTLLDSAYMTVITLSTIGYGEVVDTSHIPALRIFNIIFIILCLSTIAYAVSSVTAFIVEGELKNILGRRKMDKDIAKLEGHYIICGGDDTAVTIIREMQATKKPFVVIEHDKGKIERLMAMGQVLFVHGDATEDLVLEKAGIARAKGVLCVLPTDEANLFVTISARSLNANLRIVSRCNEQGSRNKMIKAGADVVISPKNIGGMRMVSEMIRPATTTFLDMMLREKGRVLRFDEVEIPAGSPLVGKTIAESKFGDATDALLVALRKGGGKDFTFNPAKTVTLAAGDVLVFIATPEMVEELAKLAVAAG
jgi:voltage-gated potassium channel